MIKHVVKVTGTRLVNRQPYRYPIGTLTLQTRAEAKALANVINRDHQQNDEFEAKSMINIRTESGVISVYDKADFEALMTDLHRHYKELEND